MSDVLQNIGQQRAGLISLKRLMPMLTKKDFESAAAPPHKVRAGQWKDFISARRHIEASKEAGYTEVTGSLKKATDTAPKTLLDQAFEVRELPVKMTAAPVAPSTPAPSMVTARMPQSHTSPLSEIKDLAQPPERYARSAAWRGAVRETMRLKPIVTGWMTGEAVEKCEILAGLQGLRLGDKISGLPHSWQRQHGCWQFAWDNRNVHACLKVAMNQTHVLGKLRMCDQFSGLWASNSSVFLPVEGDIRQLCGTYLMYFPEWEEIFRAGYAFGVTTNLGTRTDDHRQNSKLTRAELQKSKLYNMFPSKSTTVDTRVTRVGHMEDVKFLVGNAFDRNSVKWLVTDFSDGGIFHWSDAAMKVAQSIHLGANIQDKQVIMVTYMLEALDGLMIDPKYNVSESPGMDIFMRGNGGSRTG